MEIKDAEGVLCARVINEVYVRNLKHQDEHPTVAY